MIYLWSLGQNKIHIIWTLINWPWHTMDFVSDRSVEPPEVNKKWFWLSKYFKKSFNLWDEKDWFWLSKKRFDPCMKRLIWLGRIPGEIPLMQLCNWHQFSKMVNLSVSKLLNKSFHIWSSDDDICLNWSKITISLL